MGSVSALCKNAVAACMNQIASGNPPAKWRKWVGLRRGRSGIAGSLLCGGEGEKW
jgi:hypothetical protein